MHPRLAAVTKAYDVRGTTPDQLDAELALAFGRAYADEVEVSDGGTVVIGHDMRDSSPVLATALANGVRSRGGDVVLIGLASTDMLYAASGELDLPGIMVTASHNPAGYNGFKVCRSGARPIGFDTGLSAIAEAAGTLLGQPVGDLTGRLSEQDFLDDYAELVVSLAPVTGRRLSIVVDAGNGMAGHTARAVFDRLDVDVVEMYYELDGTFPHHEANPLDATTLVDLQAAVRQHGADLGLAFDGDADRCFVIDERGEPVSPSAITALIGTRYLSSQPGATILHNAICSKAVPEIITENGGTAVRTPVGHSLIKAEMARTGAVFGGEHSGHFYFRDFYLADSGMLAALHVMGALAQTKGTISALMERFSRYAASGEINSTVDDAAGMLARLAEAYADHAQDRLDGLTVTGESWWFNVRASNTEPLLRLNVEGDDGPTMARVRDEVLDLIRR